MFKPKDFPGFHLRTCGPMARRLTTIMSPSGDSRVISCVELSIIIIIANSVKFDPWHVQNYCLFAIK